MTRSFLSILSPMADRTTALASFIRETTTPAASATTITLRNQPLPDFTDVYGAGLLLDPATDYTIAGKTITLTSAANGTDTYQIKYYFRASA